MVTFAPYGQKTLLIVILMVYGLQLVGCLPQQPDVIVVAEFLLATPHSSFSDYVFEISCGRALPPI